MIIINKISIIKKKPEITDNRFENTNEELFTLSIIVIIALAFIFHIPKMVETYNKNDNSIIKENKI